MSYMRSGYPCQFTTGTTHSYVYNTLVPLVENPRNYEEHPEDWKGCVVDYGDDYGDVLSFIDLMARFVERATGDTDYAFKMARVLARKLHVKDGLREHRLTFDEWIDETDKKMKEVSE